MEGFFVKHLNSYANSWKSIFLIVIIVLALVGKARFTILIISFTFISVLNRYNCFKIDTNSIPKSRLLKNNCHKGISYLNALFYRTIEKFF